METIVIEDYGKLGHCTSGTRILADDGSYYTRVVGGWMDEQTLHIRATRQVALPAIQIP